ncbi:hypothetical protein ACL7TT_05125 [Microbulbifer sp. 2304DJ12-6]|uniref:hypothetical protein n=1 Tax=Microbulbifer sp. 2304DJ12-6 TaxID=3233340 RepID=UPI0039AFD224
MKIASDNYCDLSDTAYFVDSVKVPWGLTLSQARDLVKEDRQALQAYGGGPNYRGQCREAFGFKATEVNIIAPAEDCPVLQVNYNLSPPDLKSQLVEPEFWVKSISKSMGPPVKESKRTSYRIDPSQSWRVIYNARWMKGNISVTLSTSGGYRENEVGAISIAGLFIDWKNEVQFAEPYLDKIKEVENSLVISNPKELVSEIINIGKKQKPYYIADYALQNPHATANDSALRRAQRALRSPLLFDTPQKLSNLMNDSSILIWQPENRDDFVVSTKWDSVFFSKDSGKNKISWFNILPAKGSGGMSLSVNELSIDDFHSSKTLSILVGKLSIYQNKDIQCAKDYDF